MSILFILKNNLDFVKNAKFINFSISNSINNLLVK